jgi:hypothetical protein
VDTATTWREVGAEDFDSDAHAAKYRGQLEAHPQAFARLFGVLNDPANEQRLVDAEMQGMPALAGVVRFIEADPVITTVLDSGSGGLRFRQTVGVVLKLKMAKLGWRTTGRKGAVRGARHFTKAEHYRDDRPDEGGYAQRAQAALDALDGIGDDSERQVTGEALMAALAATRRDEGRPF